MKSTELLRKANMSINDFEKAIYDESIHNITDDTIDFAIPVFKSTEAIKQQPILAPSISIEDWHHFAVLFDDVAKRMVLISFVWDTRAITFITAHDYDTNEYDAVRNLTGSALAIDNNTPIKVTNRDDLHYFDYIRSFNSLSDYKRPKLVVQKNGMATEYLMNGVVLCKTRKWKDYVCSVDKNGRPSNLRDKLANVASTEWFKLSIQSVFGLVPDYVLNNCTNYFPNLNGYGNGLAISKSEVLGTIGTIETQLGLYIRK